MMQRALPNWMVGVVVFAVALSLAVFFFVLADKDQEAVLREVPKVTYQFLLIVWLGAFLKFILDRRTSELAQRDAMEDFRGELLRRTVAVADAVRRVPMLVASQRSYTEYDSQMRAVIDAYLELRALDAEIENKREAAFAGWARIREWLGSMQLYLEGLIAEFAHAQTRGIPELQVRADREPSLRGHVWSRLSELPVLRDMLETEERAVGSETTVYYTEYLKPHQDVLNLMRSELVPRTTR